MISIDTIIQIQGFAILKQVVNDSLLDRLDWGLFSHKSLENIRAGPMKFESYYMEGFGRQRILISYEKT